jgi:hypothetical protein
MTMANTNSSRRRLETLRWLPWEIPCRLRERTLSTYRWMQNKRRRP